MTPAYRIIHIDDNQDDLDRLRAVCDERIRLESYTDVPAALRSIIANPPDIIVLDIEMGHYNGLSIAQELADSRAMIVFLTSYASYALQSYSLFALHYLIKPFRSEDLDEVLNRYNRLKPLLTNDSSLQKGQISMLSQHLQHPAEPIRRIFIYHYDHLSIVNINEVFFLEAENAYTRFSTRDGRKLLSSESLKTYDEILSGHSDMIRVHRSFMVNKNYVKEIRHDKHRWYVQMANGSLIEVSRLKKDWVIAELTR